MTILERLVATGIRRLGTPRSGFRYRRAEGGWITRADRKRIEALKVPPAWTNVAIHPSPGGAVQAIGRDRAGRWQYLYHRSQVARRERLKRRRLVRFIRALPTLRRTVARDLARTGIGRERVLAGTVRILATCFLRPGSEVYATENGSYGIATLRRRHVVVRGDRVRFDFKGKSGQRQVRELSDRRVARLVRELLRHPGEVFKYQNGDGQLLDVRTRDINLYIKEVMGAAFSAKDFRTWAGSLLCAAALARPEAGLATTAIERRRRITAAVREVAEHLGNTPAVCRASYVFPAVLRGYQRGTVLRHGLDSIDARSRGAQRRLERAERDLLALLD